MSVSVDQSDAPPLPRSHALRGSVAVVLGIVVIVCVMFGAYLWITWQHRPPFPPDAVDANVTLSVLQPQQAQVKVDQFAGHGRLNVPYSSGTAGEVVGQLTFAVPPEASTDDVYSLFVIDNRTNEPVSGLWGVGSKGSHVWQGWDMAYNAVAQKYPWLASLAPVPVEGGSSWTDPGMAVSFPANTAGPITFVALLDRNAPPVSDPTSDLTVALVLIGDNGSMWAENLTDPIKAS